MDHSDHTHLSADEITEAVLLGATIYGPDDDNVGTVTEVHGIGADAVVVVDVGGFLGIGAKSVGLSASQIHLVRDEDGTVFGQVSLTEDQLKDLPEHTHSL